MTDEDKLKLREEMIKFREKHNFPKPTLENMYNQIIQDIDIERKSQNMTWEQLSEKSGVPMGSIVYAFIEKYSTFHVRLNLDEMIKLCVALDMYIATVPVWVFGCGVSFGRKDNK